MKRFLLVVSCVALALCLVMGAGVSEARAAESGEEKIAEAYKETGDYLKRTVTSPIVGGQMASGGDWALIGLVRAGVDVGENFCDIYYKNVEEVVKNNMDELGRLHFAKSTENSRVILALTAIGRDVHNVAGRDLTQALSSMEFLQKQGINGPIWALTALDSGHYEIPKLPAGSTETQATRKKIVNLILSKQLPDGGWDLAGRKADPDMTGMAVQALSKYADHNKKVKKAIDRAVTCMSEIQDIETGGYRCYGVKNTESSAQVITALSSVGIDPCADSRFTKKGFSGEHDPIDAMLEFHIKNSGFAHVITDGKLEVNGMATEQGYYTLVAYSRFLEGKNSLYDMTDVIDEGCNIFKGFEKKSKKNKKK